MAISIEFMGLSAQKDRVEFLADDAQVITVRNADAAATSFQTRETVLNYVVEHSYIGSASNATEERFFNGNTVSLEEMPDQSVCVTLPKDVDARKVADGITQAGQGALSCKMTTGAALKDIATRNLNAAAKPPSEAPVYDYE